MSEPNSLHQQSVDPVAFREIVLGLRHALVAPDALDIRVGDQVVLREWVATGPAGRGHYTLEWVVRRVTHRLSGVEGIATGFSVLSLNNASENEFATSHLRKDLHLAEREGIVQLRYFELKAAAERRKRELRQAKVPAATARVV